MESAKIPVEDSALLDALGSTFRTVCAFETDERPQSFEELKELLCRLYELVPDRPVTKNSPVKLSTLYPVPMPIPMPQATVGTAYTDRTGMASNLKSAEEWYRKAADQGSTAAQAFFSQKYPMQDADEFSETVALTGQMPGEDSAASEMIPSMSKVQFSAVAPKAVVKGEYTMVEIVMYEVHLPYLRRQLHAGGQRRNHGE